MILLHLTHANPQYIYRFRWKGPQGNQNCAQERTLFAAPIYKLCITLRIPRTVEDRSTVIRPDF